jgi:hypothetical protein
MAPRYKITLTKEEQQELENISKKGKTAARTVLLSRALLLLDANKDGEKWTVAKVADAVGLTTRTLEHMKKRFVEEGIDFAIQRKKREKPPTAKIFDGEFEAKLIALACTDAPEGRNRWTVRLLADKIVELKIAPTVSFMTVHNVLKKTNLNLT